MNELMYLPDGYEVKLGLNIPKARVTRMSLYADSAPMYTWERIRAILSDPARIPARKRFPSSKWLIRQLISDCNGQAGAAGLGRSRVIEGQSPIVLSGNALYCQISGDVDQGSMLDDGMEALMKTGICPRDMVSTRAYRRSELPPEAVAMFPNFKALECHAVNTKQELASAVCSNYMVVVAVHVSQLFASGRLDAEGIVGADRGPGNHATLVQDAVVRQDGDVKFDMVNSWGPWADNGNCYLLWERHLAETILPHMFYAIRASGSNATEPQPPTILS